MGKSQETFNKKEKEKKRVKKSQEKLKKREERKNNPKRTGLDHMIAYVDQYGKVTDTPPEEQEKVVIKAEDIELGVPKREREEISPFRQGKVEFFNTEKGFGFIKEDGSGEKFFVHVSNLTEEIVENDSVTFEIEKGLKGMNAVRVKKT